MADSNSNSSGSSSAEHSGGSGQSTRKTSRRPKVVPTDSPALNSSSSSLTPKWIAKTKAKDGHGHGGNIYNLDCDVDRETAARAVAMVVRAANKRGYVSLCTEFATLLRDKERLETELKLNVLAQKRKRMANNSNHQCASCSSESGSGGSASSTTRSTQTKPITLLDSSARLSSVGSSSLPNPCADACVSTDEYINPNDKGCSPTEKNSTADQELRKAKEYISKLEYQLYAVKAENQALKTQFRHSQKSASKASQLELTESQGHNKVVKGNKSEKDRKSPEPFSPQASPTIKGTLKKEKAQSFSTNLMKDQNPKHDQSCSLKSCVKHRIRNGFGQSMPSKVYPMPSSETPPFLSAESKPQSAGKQLVPIQLPKNQPSCDKKPLAGQMPKVLPKLGDFVVVQGEIKGFVNYIGPLKGGVSDYVGIHLNSPVGNNNGSLDGVRYFTCPANYGAFVCLQDITQVIPKSSPKEVLSVNNMPFQPKNELTCFERSTNNQFTQDQEDRQSVEIAA